MVGLKIPDNVALTALKTLRELGYSIKRLLRYNIYIFELSNETNFEDRIQKVDFLVNHNKNTGRVFKEYKPMGFAVIVQNKNQDFILDKLKKLGFNEILSVKHGVLWEFFSDEKTAVKATEELLYNKHYEVVSYRGKGSIKKQGSDNLKNSKTKNV